MLPYWNIPEENDRGAKITKIICPHIARTTLDISKVIIFLIFVSAIVELYRWVIESRVKIRVDFPRFRPEIIGFVDFLQHEGFDDITWMNVDSDDRDHLGIVKSKCDVR